MLTSIVSDRFWYQIRIALRLGRKKRAITFPGDYIGTAGMLVITQPPLMPAQLSLTSVEPNRGAPVIISFETGEKGRSRETRSALHHHSPFCPVSILV